MRVIAPDPMPLLSGSDSDDPRLADGIDLKIEIEPAEVQQLRDEIADLPDRPRRSRL